MATSQWPIAFLIAGGLAACGPEGAGEGNARERAAPADAASFQGASSADPAPFREEVANPLLRFVYAWPAPADAVAPLRARLDADRIENFEKLSASARDWKAQTVSTGIPHHRHELTKTWQVTADTPRFLSLSAEIYSYTGGAHGGTVFEALAWDRKSRNVVQPIEMFGSAAALDAAAQGPFCAELDRHRARKRENFTPGGDDPLSACIAPSESAVVILRSEGGGAIDAIGFLVAPYNAGAYAEGGYDVTLPVTAAIRDAVEPEFRGGFKAVAAPGG